MLNKIDAVEMDISLLQNVLILRVKHTCSLKTQENYYQLERIDCSRPHSI